jgi:hypothetical protein
VFGEAITIPAFAPEDFEPDEPMFASKPAFAIGDSLSMYESTSEVGLKK